MHTLPSRNWKRFQNKRRDLVPSCIRPQRYYPEDFALYPSEISFLVPNGNPAYPMHYLGSRVSGHNPDATPETSPGEPSLPSHPELLDQPPILGPESHRRSDGRFECNRIGCLKTFTRMADLRRHYKTIHLRTKSYFCSFQGCPRYNRSFARKDKRDEHEEKQHRRNQRAAACKHPLL